MQRRKHTDRIVLEVIDASLLYYQVGLIERNRQLTNRERAKQSVAVIKLMIYGPVLFGLVVDRLFGNPRSV